MRRREPRVFRDISQGRWHLRRRGRRLVQRKIRAHPRMPPIRSPAEFANHHRYGRYRRGLLSVRRWAGRVLTTKMPNTEMTAEVTGGGVDNMKIINNGE